MGGQTKNIGFLNIFYTSRSLESPEDGCLFYSLFFKEKVETLRKLYFVCKKNALLSFSPTGYKCFHVIICVTICNMQMLNEF